MRTFLPAPEDYDAHAYAHATAPAVGLPLPADAVEAVALNLERTAGFAALLAAVPDLDGDEPAPVFDPVRGGRP